MIRICPPPTIALEEQFNLPNSFKKIELPHFLESDTLNIVMYGINPPLFLADNMGMKTFD